jgi:hypothetical protein
MTHYDSPGHYSRFSRRNQRQKTVGAAEMKRLSRRYDSIKNILNKKQKEDSNEESIKEMNIYHQQVMTILTNSDFFKKLDENPIARDFFLNNQTVKHIIKRIRDDNSFFIKYQHNQEIVKFVNLFISGSTSDSDDSSTSGLPDGWKQMSDNKKRAVYLNTNKKFTTYYHPNIEKNDEKNEEISQISRDEPEVIQQADNADQPEVNEPLLDYPDQVVIFLERNSNLKLQSRLPALKDSPNLLKILDKLRSEGTHRYDRYVNVSAFAQFLSFFDADITAITYDHLNQSPTSTTTRPTTTTTSHIQTSTPKREKVKKNKNPIEEKISDLYKRLEESGYGGTRKTKNEFKPRKFSP